MDQPEHQGVMFDETGEPTPIERRYMPPGPTAFIGEDGGIREFVEARDLDAGVTRLIEAHPKELALLRQLTIVCLWRAKGGKSNGKRVLGQTKRLTGLERYLSGMMDDEPVDFVIWLAVDHLSYRSDNGIEAVLFHELCHIGADDKGKPCIVPHDWAGFAREIELYGLHTEDARHVERAFRQTRMPMAGGAS